MSGQSAWHCLSLGPGSPSEWVSPSREQLCTQRATAKTASRVWEHRCPQDTSTCRPPASPHHAAGSDDRAAPSGDQGLQAGACWVCQQSPQDVTPAAQLSHPGTPEDTPLRQRGERQCHVKHRGSTPPCNDAWPGWRHRTGVGQHLGSRPGRNGAGTPGSTRAVLYAVSSPPKKDPVLPRQAGNDHRCGHSPQHRPAGALWADLSDANTHQANS